jgi:MFS family permease
VSAPRRVGEAPGSIFSPEFSRRTIATLGLTASIVLAGNPIATAMSTIAGDVGGVRYIGWVLTSYTLASGAGLLVAGSTIDRRGLRTTFRLASLCFLVGTLACAAAPSFALLLAGRVVQGIGAGMIQAVAVASVAAVYPAHLRPRMFAANSMLWGFAGVAAPALGALATSAVGWRSLFLINVPFTVLCALAGWTSLPDAPESDERDERDRLDIIGLSLLCIVTGAILSGLSELRPRAVALLALGALGAVVYWIRAGRVRAPVLGRRQIAGPLTWKLHLLGVVAFAIPWGLGAYLPFMTRNALGFGVMLAALSLMSTSGGWLAGSLVAGRQSTFERQTHTIRIGLALVIATAGSAVVGYRTGIPAAFVIVTCTLSGFGGGLMNNVTLTLLPVISSPGEIGRNMAALQYFRSFGSAIGQAVTGACLFAGAATARDGFSRLEDALRDDVAVDPDLVEVLGTGMRAAYLVSALLAAATFVVLHRLLRSIAALVAVAEPPVAGTLAQPTRVVPSTAPGVTGQPCDGTRAETPSGQIARGEHPQT